MAHPPRRILHTLAEEAVRRDQARAGRPSPAGLLPLRHPSCHARKTQVRQQLKLNSLSDDMLKSLEEESTVQALQASRTVNQKQ